MHLGSRDCCILLVFVVYLVSVASHDEIEFSKVGAGDQAARIADLMYEILVNRNEQSV